MMDVSSTAAVAVALITVACGAVTSRLEVTSGRRRGADRTPKTAALEGGAAALQAKAPVDQIALYLVGFHPGKSHPRTQMESHHYCDQVNEDFAQCVLYDGNTENARLHDVEYIISEKLYGQLPTEEKAYWHPHNYP